MLENQCQYYFVIELDKKKLFPLTHLVRMQKMYVLTPTPPPLYALCTEVLLLIWNVRIGI